MPPPDRDGAEEPLLAQETDGVAAQDAAGQRRSSVWSFEDPDDTVGLLDEDKAGEARETVFKPEVEAEHLDGASPTDPVVVLKQAGLCAMLVCISVYESVLKSKAMRQESWVDEQGKVRGKFDITSLLIMQSLVSIVVGVGLAMFCGEREALVTNFVRQVVRYAPVGVLFGAAAYVQFVALDYLSADVFKVLEQTRLLVLGVMGYFFLKKRLSISSWVALVTITLTCLTYGSMKTGVKAEEVLIREIKRDFVRSERVNAHFHPDTAIAVDATGSILLAEEALKVVAESAAAVVPDVEELTESLGLLANGLSLGDSKSPLVGFMLTAVFVLMACSASIYSEIVLKKDHHIPYYIQKVYQEISAGAFSVSATFMLNPILVRNGIATKKLAVSFADEGDLFFGWWDSWLVPVLFIFLLAKAWLSGFIVKQLSAISKQLCSIVAVCVLYFFILMHDCERTGDPKAFFCPTNISSMNFNMVVVDIAVFCSVVSYTTALRDKRRKQMFKKRIGELEASEK